MIDIQLEVVGSVRGGLRWDLSRGALRLGRAPGNDLILTDDQVSSHHAVMALVDGQPTLSDLRSTNGTTLNGARISKPVEVAHGDVVGLGPSVHIVVELLASEVGGDEVVLEDVMAGVRLPLGRTPVRVGGHAIELVGTVGNRITCRVDGHSRVLDVGETLHLGETSLVVRRPGGIAPTVRAGEAPFPYLVHTTIDGPTGPSAVFSHQASELQHAVSAENRAILVHVLATRLGKQRAVDAAAPGWCDDESLRTGIWGMASRGQLANNLNVVIRRTRQELDQAGFDGGCIQKVYGHTRLHVARVDP